MIFIRTLALLCNPRPDYLLVVLCATRPIGRLLRGVVTARDRRRIALRDAAALDLVNRIVSASFRCLGAGLSRLGAARSDGGRGDAETALVRVLIALALAGVGVVLNRLATCGRSIGIVGLQVDRHRLV